MSHSNGRWYVDGHYVKVLKPEREFLNEGAPETICEMQSSVSPEETTANQRLIAAAPELLEACRAAMELVARVALVHRESMTQAEYTTTQNALLSAIAKATGATP